MTRIAVSTPAEYATLVIEQTRAAWRIAPVSTREVARRAPHGYVPRRVLHRARVPVQASNWPAFEHSW